MNSDITPTSIEEDDARKRTLILTMIGVIIVGTCALFALAFLWFRPNESTLFAKYFPSPTATRSPTNTPVPSKTPAPNLTATQAAWVKPSQSPELGSKQEAQTALDAGMNYLENYVISIPDTPEVNQPGDVYIYEILLDQYESVLWSYGWCTTTQSILEENFTHMQVEFITNEDLVTSDHLLIQDKTRDDGSPCRDYIAMINKWPQGQHQLEIRVTFTTPTDDGWNIYPKGTHTFKYLVSVN